MSAIPARSFYLRRFSGPLVRLVLPDWSRTGPALLGLGATDRGHSAVTLDMAKLLIQSPPYPPPFLNLSVKKVLHLFVFLFRTQALRWLVPAPVFRQSAPLPLLLVRPINLADQVLASQHFKDFLADLACIGLNAHLLDGLIQASLVVLRFPVFSGVRSSLRLRLAAKRGAESELEVGALVAGVRLRVFRRASVRPRVGSELAGAAARIDGWRTPARRFHEFR